MKRLLAVLLIALFTAAVLSPAAFADCAGKSHGGKTATGTQPKPTTSA